MNFRFLVHFFVTMTQGCSRCTSSAMQVLTLTKPTKEAPLSEHHALHLNFIFSNDSSHDFERLRFSEILLMGDTHVPEKQEKQLNHVPKIQVKLVHFFGLCTKQLFLYMKMAKNKYFWRAKRLTSLHFTLSQSKAHELFSFSLPLMKRIIENNGKDENGKCRRCKSHFNSFLTKKRKPKFFSGQGRDLFELLSKLWKTWNL